MPATDQSFGMKRNFVNNNEKSLQGLMELHKYGAKQLQGAEEALNKLQGAEAASGLAASNNGQAKEEQPQI